MNMETVYNALQNATGCAVRGDGADWPLPWVSFQDKTKDGHAQMQVEVRSLSRESCDSLSAATQNALYALGYALKNSNNYENWESGAFIKKMLFHRLLTAELYINGQKVGGLYALSIKRLSYSALNDGGVRSIEGGAMGLVLSFIHNPDDLGQQAALTGGQMAFNNKTYLCALQEAKAQGRIITCQYLIEEKETP